MAISITSLKRICINIKSRLTRFRHLDIYESSTEDPIELKEWLDKAEECFKDFNKCEDAIHHLDADKSLTDELQSENETFESLYYQAISKVQQLTNSKK